MSDKSKTKSQLIEELDKLRQQVAELEAMAPSALSSEQDLIQTIINTSPAFHLLIDVQGKIVMMNRSMVEGLGYSEEEIQGKDYLSNFVPERERDQLSALFEKQLLKGKSAIYQNGVQAKDGRVLLVEWQGRPILDPNDEVEFFLGVGLDITERKPVEESLRRSEQRHRLLVKNIPSVAWITARDGQTVYLSDNVEKVYGYTSDEISSAGPDLWIGRIHPKDRERVQEAFELLFSKQEDFRIEYRIQRKDGEWIWLLDSANMVTDEAGQQLAYGAFTDITESKQAEIILQESEERFRRLSEISFEGIGISENGIILDANAQLAKMLGYTHDELLGMKVEKVVAPESLDFVQEQIRSGSDGPYEHQAIRKYNSIFTVEVHSKSVPYEGRTVRVTSIRDITERKQAEEAYRVLVEGSLQGLVIIQDGRFIFANPITEIITGYSDNELLGLENPIQTLVHPEDLPGVLERGSKRARGEAVPPRAIYRIVNKSGGTRWVESYLNQIEIRGKPASHLVFIDITERKQAEDELQRISQEDIKRREELEKLRDISTSMRRAKGSTNLLEVFTKEVQAFCNADITASIMFKENKESAPYFAPEANSQLSQVQVKAIRNALLGTKTSAIRASIPDFESILILPLQSAEKTHGAVMVASRKADAFTRDEQNMLNAIADMAGTALYRIDILESTEQQVERRTHDLVLLYNLITIISENWQLQDLLELSLSLTLETVKANRGIIYLVDEKDTGSLKPVIQRGFADGFQIEAGSMPDDKLAQIVLKKEKPLALANLADNPTYTAFDGINSYAGIPILTRGKVRGVFSLFANGKESFGSEQMALLVSIADHIGIGIENSILFEKSRESAALEERNRLARNLHDSVSQLLYSLTLMAGSTKKMLEREYDLEAVKNSVARLGDTAQQALGEMRLLLYELRPAVLDSEGLDSALQHRIETVEERLGVKVDLQTAKLPELPSDIEDALYHIALEGLNNIVKHSGSTTASISITSDSKNVVMEISDEGSGYVADQSRKGHGLRNMHERVQILGGKVVVDSQPGEGTRITVKVELPSDSLGSP